MTEKLLTETLNYKSNQTKLFQGLRALNEEEEVRLHEILATISDNVRRRRLMMYPYFKDYDRVRDVKFNTSCDARKPVVGGFGPGLTQTSLSSHRRRLEALNFGFKKTGIVLSE